MRRLMQQRNLPLNPDHHVLWVLQFEPELSSYKVKLLTQEQLRSNTSALSPTQSKPPSKWEMERKYLDLFEKACEELSKSLQDPRQLKRNPLLDETKQTNLRLDYLDDLMEKFTELLRRLKPPTQEE